MKNILLIFSYCILLSSCAIIGKTVYKVDIRPNWKTNEDIHNDFDKYQIPLNQAFVLDTASYYNAVSTTYKNRISNTTDSTQLFNFKMNKKNDRQPVQIRFFDKEGNAIFKMINCFLKLKVDKPWNFENCFDEFPPKEISEIKNDINEDFYYFLPHIKDMNGNALSLDNLPKSNYYALVFWNDIMFGPSEDLINQLHEYQAKFPSEKVKYIFVNNHNAYIWSLLEPKMKRKVIDKFYTN